ncbi:MAG: ribulose-bisphosphate carboxylase large subunit family protein [Bryobacterales bacterium]|nr:ribulose-bisphosphate carboxylase large subunit family protein [Bryobacterales bacterium]
MPDWSDSRIYAHYLIETAFPVEQAAETMAGEQSSGTFVRVPGETSELRARHAARVENIELLERVSSPSLPGSGIPAGQAGPPVYQRAKVLLSWPLDNLGPSLPNLMATVAGNLFELRAFSGLKLLDLRLPPAFLDAYPGPQFAVAGTRRLAGVEHLPLVGTIIKPSVGLTPEATAEMVRTLVGAGIDFIKDDELQCDGPHCPFEARVEAVMRVINDSASAAGKKAMFAFNVTGEVDQMKRRHDIVAAHGGNCVMVSLNGVGLAGLTALRRHSQVPIHAHRNGWGMFDRSPALGMSFVAWQKFWRVAGTDHIHVNGLRNKFCESDASVIASARECLTPMFDVPGKGCQIMPVFSSGQSAGRAFDTWRALGSADLIFACGGGIAAHPGGPAAGVRSVRQAWQAAMDGLTADEAAARHTELRQALEKFGR